jgi:hypothetical protein
VFSTPSPATTMSSTVRTATRPSTAVNTLLLSTATLTWKDEPSVADSAFAYA